MGKNNWQDDPAIKELLIALGITGRIKEINLIIHQNHVRFNGIDAQGVRFGGETRGVTFRGEAAKNFFNRLGTFNPSVMSEMDVGLDEDTELLPVK